MYILFKYRSNFIQSISLGSLFIFVFIMAQTGGRGPLVAVVFSAILYTLWILLRTDTNSSPLSGGLIVLFVLSVLISILMTSGPTIRRLTMLIDDPGGSFLIRLDMISKSFNYISNHPVIGNGLGSFEVLYMAGPQSYPHNIILEFLVEAGLIGASLFLCYLAVLFRYIMIKSRTSPIYSGLIMSIFLFYGLNSMLSGDIPTNRHLFILTIPIISRFR
ncbi:O-antigen ligase family protein [Halobacterium salinarum]|uniref:O-antigen ligase family protein n=1 Tax=Halobacterium salinarum TaxID=2242 RepID=UPI0033130510